MLCYVTHVLVIVTCDRKNHKNSLLQSSARPFLFCAFATSDKTAGSFKIK